jgi:hypothetical protein
MYTLLLFQGLKLWASTAEPTATAERVAAAATDNRILLDIVRLLVIGKGYR